MAKFELANHRYRAALDAAVAGVRVTPFTETLGYQADAQAALGSVHAAATTRAVIFAIERIGNAYHVNDRLLASYYADHRLRPDAALAIERREVAVRGNEISAQDTLAWAAAMDNQWNLALRASAKATRYNTQDPIVQYHAGIIALHLGRRDEAKQRLRNAIAANPHFGQGGCGTTASALAGREKTRGVRIGPECFAEATSDEMGALGFARHTRATLQRCDRRATKSSAEHAGSRQGFFRNCES